jgi:hypothetical protein
MKIEFGEQWVYDGEYLSCEMYSYHIEKMALVNMDWILHMSYKRWVNQEEFKKGYEYVLNEIKNDRQRKN